MCTDIPLAGLLCLSALWHNRSPTHLTSQKRGVRTEVLKMKKPGLCSEETFRETILALILYSKSKVRLRRKGRPHGKLSCIFVCHPHLTSIFFVTAFWAQVCGLEPETPLSLSCIFGPQVSTIVVCFCWCTGGSSITILPLLVQMLLTLATDSFGFECVGEPATVSRYCRFCGRL